MQIHSLGFSLGIYRPDAHGGQELIFSGMHGSGLTRIMIIMTCQMKQPVHGIEQQFRSRIVAVLRRALHGDISTDDNITLKCGA